MFKFKKDKEYNLYINDWKYNLLFIGRDKDMLIFHDIHGITYKCQVDNIMDISEPVSATEMFQMYTNWNNFHREGIHQDLEFAENIRSKINNTLVERKYVVVGSGKLEPFDFRLIDKMKLDLI